MPLKLVFNLRRKQGMSRDEFQKYWRETHAPLVAKHSQTLGIRKYHQLHTIEYGQGIAHVRGSHGQEFDGVAELWFDSQEFLDENGKRPEAQAAGLELLEDEKNFIDLANSPIFWVHENKVVDPHPSTL